MSREINIVECLFSVVVIRWNICGKGRPKEILTSTESCRFNLMIEGMY